VEHSTTTIQDIIDRRLETGLGDLLLELYHAGYCAGARLPLELPHEAGVGDLVLLIDARHNDEIRRPRGWADLDDPPANADEHIAWLLKQPQQADPVRVRAAIERQVALGDVTFETAPPKRS
jgi:hypothetical protein